eukprot:6007295-Alexandrium_andersonii.AAC.1
MFGQGVIRQSGFRRFAWLFSAEPSSPCPQELMPPPLEPHNDRLHHQANTHQSFELTAAISAEGFGSGTRQNGQD